MKKNLLLTLFIFCSTSAFTQWVNDPMINTTAATGTEFINPIGVGDSSGATYISYREYNGGGYNTRMQRLDSQGNPLFGTGGLLVSAEDSSQSFTTVYTMAVDAEDNAIVTWQDSRTGNFDVFASKVTAAGALPWTGGGVQLSSSPNTDVDPQVLPMKDGSVIFAWQTEDSSGLRLQRLSGSGNPQWGPDGILYAFSPSVTQHFLSYPHLVMADDTSFYLIYKRANASFNASQQGLDIMRYGLSGQPLWPGVDTLVNGNIPNFLTLNAITDGNAGMIVAWLDSRVSGFYLSGFVQWVFPDGTTRFAPGGVGVLAASSLALDNIVPGFDGTNVYGFFSSGTELWMQGVDTSGNLLLGNNALQITSTSNAFRELQARPVAGDFVVSWVEDLAFPNSVMRATRLNASGAPVWIPAVTDVSTVSGSKGDASLTEEKNGQLVETWADDRTGTNEIYAQNINADGSLGLGIRAVQDVHATLYPNPATRTLYWTTGPAADVALSVQVLSADGRLVFSHESAARSGALDVSGMYPGMYILKIQGKSGSSVSKFFVGN